MALVSNWLRTALARGDIDLQAETLRALLIGAAHAPNADDDAVAAVAAAEIDDDSYGRVDVTGAAVTRDDDGNVAVFTADPVVFAGLAGSATPEHMVIFRVGTDDDASRVVSYHLIRDGSGNPIAPNGQDYTVPPHPDNGYVRLQ